MEPGDDMTSSLRYRSSRTTKGFSEHVFDVAQVPESNPYGDSYPETSWILSYDFRFDWQNIQSGTFWSRRTTASWPTEDIRHRGNEEFSDHRLLPRSFLCRNDCRCCLVVSFIRNQPCHQRTPRMELVPSFSKPLAGFRFGASIDITALELFVQKNHSR